MNVTQLRISRRSITMVAAFLGMVSLAIGAHAALNMRALDAAKAVEATFDIITGIRDAGTTVLMVEQNASAALDMCDHAYLLESGSLAALNAQRFVIARPRA